MKEPSPYQTFLENLQTKEDLADFVDQIRAAGQQSFKTSVAGTTGLSKDFLGKLAEAEKNGFFPNQISQQAKFFRDLEAFVASQKVVSLILSFEPSQAFIDRIRKFLGSEKEEIFLDISIDPEIMGGFILDNNGLYRDYSLAKQLEDFQEDKSFFKEILARTK